MADVVVVGGGVGGLGAALRLAGAGHHVTVFERHAVVGGKLGLRGHDGFSFDTGPSLLTLPDLLDDVLSVAGTSLAAEVSPVRLDPQIRYRWPDGAMLDVRDDPAATEAAFEAFHAGAGAAWRRWDDRGRRIWEVSQRTFLAGPMGSPRSWLRRLRSPGDLLAIDARRTLHSAARATFADRRLVQWAGRYATYSGSSPLRAPATLGCIAHVESASGVWYVPGGLGRLAAVLGEVCHRVGVVVEVGAEVARIDTAGDRVTGVELVGGGGVGADVVVVNADAAHLYADLLADPIALARVRRAEPSTSGVLLHLAVDGRSDGVAHHNVWFSGDEAAEFQQLFRGREVPDDPTVYACVPSVTDSDRAPDGCESWTLLVNAPAGWQGDQERYADHVLAVLAERGVDLRLRVRARAVVGPAELEARFRAPGGAIYGSSSNSRRAAFLRPGNRGSHRGLYLVGGSTHPGGGLPLVATSARIVADLVEADGW